MVEVWKDIPDFPGYQVSNTGKVRSFWKKQKRFGTYGGTERILCKEPHHELLQSDDGNGYMKVFLQNDYCKRCVKVHRLVAEAFIYRESVELDTVDHIESGPVGKLDNSVTNLRWISRRDNIRKAYKDGMCNERIQRQRKPILVTDTWSGKEIFFNSVRDAAYFIRRDYTSISHALNKDILVARRYLVESITGEDLLIYGGGEFDEINYY